MTDHRIVFSKLDWTIPLPGVRHKIQQIGTQILRLVEYSSEMKPHWCERGHVGYILEGRFEIELADETLVFAAGDGVYIPGGRSHRHRARVLTSIVRALFVEDA